DRRWVQWRTHPFFDPQRSGHKEKLVTIEPFRLLGSSFVLASGFPQLRSGVSGNPVVSRSLRRRRLRSYSEICPNVAELMFKFGSEALPPKNLFGPNGSSIVPFVAAGRLLRCRRLTYFGRINFCDRFSARLDSGELSKELTLSRNVVTRKSCGLVA